MNNFKAVDFMRKQREMLSEKYLSLSEQELLKLKNVYEDINWYNGKNETLKREK